MSNSRTEPSSTQFANEFFNRTVILSIALFTVNNWWLKHTFQNWVTGKLSDFLFCFFFPLYCSAVLSVVTKWKLRTRIWFGVFTTLASFVAMKTSPLVSSWANEKLSVVSRVVFGQTSINVVDYTDLLASPVVMFSVLFALKLEKTT